MNRAHIMGRLGGDPETKAMPSGTEVCNFSVATSRRTKDGEQTEWHRCIAFGKTAEIIGKYLHKGDMAAFEGRIQTRSWEKDGVKRYSTEIVVDRMHFAGGRQDAQAGRSQPAPAPQANAAPAQGEAFEDDDIPF
jgi:single-strand DNA-binding protein